MPTQVALLLCIVGIAGLFYLDRDKSVQTSAALWLPFFWIGIGGSRPVSNWFNYSNPTGLDAQLDGTQPDRLIFQVLVIAAVTVLFFRAKRTSAYLAVSWPILIYLFYCLASCGWSEYPGVSAKRWIKLVGDLAMVLVVLTDPEPVKAFKRLITRLGCIILPFSLLLIHYYDYWGHSYGADGERANTGVATDKNTLGVITLVITLGLIWTFLDLLGDKNRPDRKRHLIVHGTLLLFGIALLYQAHSATAGTCCSMGAALMLLTRLPAIKRSPGAVHALVLTLLVVGGLTFFLGGEGDVASALGRNSNLTGRTDIWAAVIPACPNKLVGAGFEDFWIGPWQRIKFTALKGWRGGDGLSEAHNGYVETYLNLGWIGVGLIALILVDGYRKVVAAFRRDPAMGGMFLGYLFAAAFYSITEVGFRVLNPIWIFLLMAIVASAGISSGLISQAAETAVKPVTLRNFHASRQQRLEVAAPVRRTT